MNDAANPTDAGPAEYDEYNMPEGVDAKAVTAAADAGGAAIDLDDQIDEEELLVTPGMNWFKTMKAGKQKIVETKLYPGYVFVEMQLEDDGRIPQDVFFLIKETTGVGDFIGTAGRPSPMSIPEIEKMLMASKPAEEQPQVKMEFQKGDHIRITSGAFENMEGTVDELMPDQGKVKVIVTIFGRATPIELEYWIIEKFEE